MKNNNYRYFRYTDTFIDIPNNNQKKDKVNEAITAILSDISITDYKKYLQLANFDKIENIIKARVGGQGLLIGSSLIDYGELKIDTDNSDMYDIRNFFQNSLQFDYTMGHVYVPGSSLKGAFRSYIHEGSSSLMSVYKKLQEKLCFTEINECILKLENDLFEGIGSKSVIYHDSFFEAIENTQGIIPSYIMYNSEFITPHTKDVESDKLEPEHTPNPLYMLKVVSGTTLNININIPDCLIKEYKEYGINLYTDVLVVGLGEFGIGAKTNTGFGHFDKIEYKGRK